MSSETTFSSLRSDLLAAFDQLDDAMHVLYPERVRARIDRALECFHADDRPTQDDLLQRWERHRHLGLRRCNKCLNHYPRPFVVYDEMDDFVCFECAASDAHDTSDWRNGRIQWYEPEPDYDYDEEDEGYDGLLSHSASPIDKIGKPYLALSDERTSYRTRFFGCEIEFTTSTRDQLAAIVNRYCYGIGIYKQDGSLSGFAAEFCTLPMTMRAAELYLRPVLDDMVAGGARAWNRSDCGLHIHVSVASATWTTWGKVERFFLHKHNQAFLNRIAGRAPNGYCNRYGVGDHVPVKKARQSAYNGDDRYKALNFSTNKPTVEFRLFRGNVSFAGVMRCMQFCDSLINFAAAQSNEAEMDYMSYLLWLRSHAKAYPYLGRFLKGKTVETDLKEAA